MDKVLVKVVKVNQSQVVKRKFKMGLKLERFERLSKLQSESLKFFSNASYEVESEDFKINTAHLAKVVSVLFQYLKPEIEDHIKEHEKEEEVSVDFNTSSSSITHGFIFRSKS